MNQKESYEFTKLYDEILPVQYLKATDGTTVTLSINTKVIWCYMYRRYDFYGRLGNDFYENLSDISKKLGIPERTLCRSVSTLQTANVIKIRKKKVHGFIASNIYIVKHPVEYCKTNKLIPK